MTPQKQVRWGAEDEAAKASRYFSESQALVARIRNDPNYQVVLPVAELVAFNAQRWLESCQMLNQELMQLNRRK